MGISIRLSESEDVLQIEQKIIRKIL